MMESINKKKPAVKRRAPPVIRQTKTSMYRTLKANPLILCDQESIRKIGIQDLTKIPKSVDVLGITTSDNKSLLKFGDVSVINHNQLVKNTVTNKKPINKKNSHINGSQTEKHVPTIKRAPSAKGLPMVRQSISSMYRQKISHNKRRSKSADRYVSNKCITEYKHENSSNHEVTKSMDDITRELMVDDHYSPICKNYQKVTFKTPLAYNRRSVTPLTSFASTPASEDLKKRLNDWLTKRGKSVDNFHHLKCFGLHKTRCESLIEEMNSDEENKENTETENIQNKNNKTDIELKISKAIPINYNSIAKDALDDLHKLIDEGYPSDLCEAWLERIRQKYNQLEEEPLYWECRAALDQTRGHITSAVDHYRKAIVQGAEVSIIEESLDQLLEKFSLLNINPNMNKEDPRNNRIVLDARNAFKSTIIQFAVQERILKKRGEETQRRQVTVTPVRRSSRLSVMRSATPGIKLCNSLKEVNMIDDVKFEKNNYL